MTYAPGEVVTAADFNSMAGTVNAAWGNGSGGRGIGQSDLVPTVGAGNLIYGSEWATLMDRANRCAIHNLGTGYNSGIPTSIEAATQLITATGRTTPLSNAISWAYNYPGGTGIARPETSIGSVSSGSSWTNGMYHRFRVDFASGDHARHFFNAGGQIQLYFSHEGGVTQRRNEWADFLANTVTPLMNYSYGNYWWTSGGWQRWITSYDPAGYTQNYSFTNVLWGGSAGTGGGYSMIYFDTYWYDDHENVFQPEVSGGNYASLALRSPSTAYIANSWGSPSIGESTMYAI